MYGGIGLSKIIKTSSRISKTAEPSNREQMGLVDSRDAKMDTSFPWKCSVISIFK